MRTCEYLTKGRLKAIREYGVAHDISIVNTCREEGVSGRRNRVDRPAWSELMTAQYGAKSLGQWLNAVLSMRGESSTMPVSEAVEMIRSTPLEKRSEFARQIWQKRREHYGSSGRYDAVPF